MKQLQAAWPAARLTDRRPAGLDEPRSSNIRTQREIVPFMGIRETHDVPARADIAVMNSSVHPIAPQRLAALAKPFRINKPEDAGGRCLSLSLDIALEAKRRLGVDALLVRWSVVDDAHYVDHWAVALDDQHVIDATRVQVDGRRTLVCSIDDYPANFRNRRSYPASLLTTAYQECRPADSARLPDRFMWTCGTRLLAFDLAEAVRHRHLRGFASALRSGATFLRWFAMSATTHALARRAGTLLERLQSQPKFAARGSSHDTSTQPRDGRSGVASILSAHPALIDVGALAPTVEAAISLALMCA